MGVTGGLFMLDRKVRWPATNLADSLYQKDLRHFVGPVGRSAVAAPMSHMHMEH